MQNSRNNTSQILCPHCQKKIISSNFLLHEARCQLRRSRFINEEPHIRQQQPHQNLSREAGTIHKNKEGFSHQRPRQNERFERKKIFEEIKRQEEEKIPCTNCGYMQTLLELDTHPNECPFNGKPCTYCGQSFPLSLMDQHLQVCSARLPPQHLHHIHHEGHYPQEEIIESDEEDQPFGNFNHFFINLGGYNRMPRSRTIQTINNTTIIQETDGQGRIIRREIINSPQPSRIFGEQLTERRRNFNPFGDFFRLIEILASRSGAEQGLTQQQLKNLPRINYKLNKNSEKDLCTICYCQFEQNEKIIQLRCKHLYHEQCIVKWLQKNAKCPVCKTPQTNRPIYNEE